MTQLPKYVNNIFRIYYIWFMFAFAAFTFITQFVGIESNLLSIVVRAVTVIIALIGLINVIRFRLWILNVDYWLFQLFWFFYSIRIMYDIAFHKNDLIFGVADHLLFAFLLSYLCSIIMFNKAIFSVKKIDIPVFFVLIFINLCGFLYNLFSPTYLLDRAVGNDRLNQITFGTLGGFLCLFSIWFIVYRPQKKIWNLLGITGVGLGFVNLIIAGSKGPIIYFFLVLIMFLYRSFIKRAYTVIGVFLLICIAILFLLNYFGLFQAFELLLFRFSGVQSDNLDESSADRVSYLTGAISQFIESPFLGSFIEVKGIAVYPHNPFIESLMALGIFGGIIYFIIMCRLVYKNIKLIFLTNFHYIPVFAFAAFTVGMFSGSLSFGIDLWFSIAVINNLYYHIVQNKFQVKI